MLAWYYPYLQPNKETTLTIYKKYYKHTLTARRHQRENSSNIQLLILVNNNLKGISNIKSKFNKSILKKIKRTAIKPFLGKIKEIVKGLLKHLNPFIGTLFQLLPNLIYFHSINNAIDRICRPDTKKMVRYINSL